MTETWQDNQSKLPLDLDAIRERAENDFYFFAKGVLGYDWLHPRIHLPLCRELQSGFGKRLRLLSIFPRGWLKSTICTISWPIWCSIIDENIRILLVQNSASNAYKKLSEIRKQWEGNALLRALYPQLLPKSDAVWRSDSVCLTRTKSYPESTYEAAGAATKVTSRHYDIVVEDDTVAPDLDEMGVEALAPSYTDVERAIGWHRANVIPLLHGDGGGDSVVVGTRWYDYDLLRWIKDKQPEYKVMTRACRENDAGEPDARGHVTYPERFDVDVLKEIERSLGPYLFSTLYMNTPVRSEDMLFHPEWFQRYETPPASLMVYTTVDSATDPSLAVGKDLDYSVVMTCGKDMITGRIYVLDYFRGQCNPGELISRIIQHVAAYRPVVVGYENVAFERSLGYWLRERMRIDNLHFMLEQIPAGKERRIPGLQPMYANGSIFHRDTMAELESELLEYPLGRHDDIIDALSMQLHFWKRTHQTEKPDVVARIDPLSFDYAMQEIQNRQRIAAGSLGLSQFDNPGVLYANY
jgi:predicted phage terminase large subunit-like protein